MVALADDKARTTVLRTVLHDEDWRAQLREHLTATLASENVDFYTSVFELSERMTPAEQCDKAKRIVETFVLDSGSSQVLLSVETRNTLIKLYEAKNWPELVLSFKPALEELFRDLKHAPGFNSFVVAKAADGDIVFEPAFVL